MPAGALTSAGIGIDRIKIVANQRSQMCRHLAAFHGPLGFATITGIRVGVRHSGSNRTGLRSYEKLLIFSACWKRSRLALVFAPPVGRRTGGSFAILRSPSFARSLGETAASVYPRIRRTASGWLAAS